MVKLLKTLLICQFLVILVIVGMLLADKHTLSSGILRLHVVANSNSEHDQLVKLQVRDAVIATLKEPLKEMQTSTDAKEYVENNLSKIEQAANAALRNANSTDRATVTLCREAFETRHYDTFSLPSGVYDSICVNIGKGEGVNWWCVVFPDFCMQATSRDMRISAVSSGFSSHLSHTLTDSERTISFFLLDCIGRLENIFYFP